MKNNRSAAHLADALQARGIRVQRIDFADEDVTTLHTQAEQLAHRIGGQQVTINFTGGTKPMTLALVQTLAADLATRPGACEPHLVYCDTAHQRLDWLAPEPVSEPMRPILRIDDILLTQGYRRLAGTGGHHHADWHHNAQQRAQLTRWLGEHSAEIDRFFGTLNALAKAALGENENRFEPQQYFEFQPGGAAAQLLKKAQEFNLLHWNGRQQVQFRSRDAAQYLGGGWVEEYAALKLSGAQPNGGWEPRLTVEHVDTRTVNELDAVLVHNNRMLVVECKAARPGEDASDWIYKLSQLARAVGGQLAQPLLLSARPLNASQQARAREYRVDVLAAAELKKLPAYLQQWLRGP
ncbi:Card1-like endonuclease domain-containing protein [Tepidimonas sp.]|uniref:Card1-like endonuclease domain-containing protein n=1 Tax=Tepidimonas sp. TaxID=2002775 RepID=UPI0039A3294F